MKRPKERGKVDPRKAPPDPRRRALAAATLAALALLVFTAEERTFGTISDEQQMLSAAVSLAEFGEIGIARGQVFTVHRTAGDAVSPYGMGLSIAEAIPSFFAGSFEKSFGAGASQTLFVSLQILLVTLAAWAAGRLVLLLGGSRAGIGVAVLGTAIGSPLWAYPAAGYSEPLQAAAMALALLLSCLCVRGDEKNGNRAAFGAGLAAGVAVLTKGLNLVLVPLLLAPLLLEGRDLDRKRRARLALLASAGGAVPGVAWLALEILRFGRPLASYGGFGFTHPFFDGLWRLLVGPNKGIFVYFPLLLLSIAGIVALAKNGETRCTALAIAGSFGVVLVLSAAWWAWDGTVGWGPRLLVSLIPLLAVAAGWVIGERVLLRRAGFALVALGAGVNALGVFQTEAAAAAYASSAPPLVLTESQARTLPMLFVKQRDGRLEIDRQFVAASDATLAPIRVHAFLLGARLGAKDTEDLKRRLESPPWLANRPELAPNLSGSASALQSLVYYLESPFHWPHLGSAMARKSPAEVEAFGRAWDDAQVDQILRALDVGRPDRASALAERLLDIAPSGYAAALYAESLRARNRPEALEAFLKSLPREFFGSPSLGVVEALVARDRGDEAAARGILGQVQRVFPRPGITKALAHPMAEWPKGLHGMTGENLEDRKLELPGVK